MSQRGFDDLDEASQDIVSAWQQDKRDRADLAREFAAALAQRAAQGAAALAAEKEAARAARQAAADADRSGAIRPLPPTHIPERR